MESVYLAFLTVCLKPQEGFPANTEVAMRLLNSEHRLLNPSKVLALLPADTRMADLQPFLEAVVRDLNSKKRNGQIVRNITKVRIVWTYLALTVLSH